MPADERRSGLLAGPSQAAPRGEAGIGRTPLLAHLVDRARGCAAATASVIESDLQLDDAGVSQRCTPHLDRLTALAAARGRQSGTCADVTPDGAGGTSSTRARRPATPVGGALDTHQGGRR